MSDEKHVVSGETDPLIANSAATSDTQQHRRPQKLHWKWSVLFLVAFFASFAYFIHLVFSAVNAPAPDNRPHFYKDKEHIRRALEILTENPLIDGHNDLAILVRVLYKNHIYDTSFEKEWEKGGLTGHVDVPRIRRGKYGGAFWSAFMPCQSDVNDFSDEAYYPSTYFID